MANNRIYLYCKCGKHGTSIAKFYPSSGWFAPRPTPRDGISTPEEEYIARIDEVLNCPEADQDSSIGSKDFHIEYEQDPIT